MILKNPLPILSTIFSYFTSVGYEFYKMSNSRNDNRISGAKPFNSLDNNIVKNVELSKIHQGMSSEPTLSSHENLKDNNCQPSKVSSMTL